MWVLFGSPAPTQTVQDDAQLKVACDVSPPVRAVYTLGLESRAEWTLAIRACRQQQRCGPQRHRGPGRTLRVAQRHPNSERGRHPHHRLRERLPVPQRRLERGGPDRQPDLCRLHRHRQHPQPCPHRQMAAASAICRRACLPVSCTPIERWSASLGHGTVGASTASSTTATPTTRSTKASAAASSARCECRTGSAPNGA